MKNFGYEIRKDEFSDQAIVGIYSLCGAKKKEYRAKVAGMELPATGAVVDGLHYPDPQGSGNWRFAVKHIPSSKEIPSGVALEDGAVMIYGERLLSKGAPQSIGEVRENRNASGGNEWHDTTTFIQDGKKNQIVPGLLVLPSVFGEQWFVAHGKLWKAKPRGVCVPKWVLELI